MRGTRDTVIPCALVYTGDLMKTFAIVLALALPSSALAQTAADSAGILATAHNYIDGWYEGNAARMQSALHHDLAKRIVMPGRGGTADELQHLTAEQLVESTARGGGSSTPANRRRNDMRILDIFTNAAVVRVDASDWVDYLQLGRIDGQWKIVNVLWALRPEVR